MKREKGREREGGGECWAFILEDTQFKSIFLITYFLLIIKSGLVKNVVPETPPVEKHCCNGNVKTYVAI